MRKKLWRLWIVPNESSVYDDFQQRIWYSGKMVRGQSSLEEATSHAFYLIDNYSLSKIRQVFLLSRLRNAPEVLREYHAAIRFRNN